MERSKAEKTIVLLFSAGSFLMPPGFRLLVELGFVLVETHYLSAVMSFLLRPKFTRALITLCFTVEWIVRHVLIYFRKPMMSNEV